LRNVSPGTGLPFLLFVCRTIDKPAVTKKKKTPEEDKGFLGRLGAVLITGSSDDDREG
jgi:hypothetical protein